MTLARDIAVDMDGTLLKVDTLHEGFLQALFLQPLEALKALLMLPRGRAAVKARLAGFSTEGVSLFPPHSEFVGWLQQQADGGRRLHLVTAADRTVADAVAARFGFFDSVLATESGKNLKGSSKRDRLIEQFPEGFAYCGDHDADLPVFEAAESIIIVGRRTRLGKVARLKGQAIEAEFPETQKPFRAWRKALRVHQWSKNFLMFIPLLLSGRFLDAPRVLDVIAGFLLMGIAASGTYILNDLSDLNSDRAHRTKRNRPFASGALPGASGLVAAILLIAAGLGAGLLLSPAFALLLFIYVAITVSYSLFFKRVVILDVAILATLYGIRLGMGAALAEVVFSKWLMVFAVFFFLSLSLAKRHVELVRAGIAQEGAVAGRGYLAADAPLTLTLGLAAGMTSLLVMVIFLILQALLPGTYANPDFLWAAPLLIFLWMGRVWVLASRGQLEDDPVSFAVKDRTSQFLGLILGVTTLLAVLRFN